MNEESGVNEINIKLDFSSIDCDSGHSNAYTNAKCEICGEDFSEFEPHIDPKVEMRKEMVNPILDVINAKLLERKIWFKKFRKNEVSRVHVDEPFYKLQSLISDLSSISIIDIFEDVSFHSDELTNEITKVELELYKERMVNLISIKFEAEKLELFGIWKNMNRRLINSIQNIFDGYLDFIYTLVAPNLKAAQLLQISGQEKVDFATNEITILDKIISNEQSMISTDIFYGGEINQSALISMIFSCQDSISETIHESTKITKYYFRNLIGQSILEDDLISLAPYMYLGTSVFDDEDYTRKISVVTTILRDAMDLEPIRFKNFMSMYTDRYLFAQRKAVDIASDYAFVYGNKPSIEILMRQSIKWYKDFSEGIYKDISRIVYFSMKVINNAEFEDNDILTWLGFGDIIGSFESQKKLKLNLLTEGVDKIIRHAEAHVDYEIGDGKITLRNVVPRDKQINYAEYSYEEFITTTNKLAESVYAIICGIQIHLLNNYEAFSEEINLINDNQNYSLAADMTGVVFTLNGIIILNKKIEQDVLIIEGLLNRAVDKKDIGDKIFSACGQSMLFDAEYREIQFYLYNFDNEFLGKVTVQTQYFYQYKIDSSDFKNFYIILAKLTSSIDSSFHDNITDDKDLICLKTVYVHLFEICSDINSLIREKKSNNNDVIASELKVARHKTHNLKRFLSMYSPHNKDKVILVHISMLVNQLDIAITHMLAAGLFSPSIGEDLRNFNIISDSASRFTDYLFNKITKDEYLKQYLHSKPYLPRELTANSPCPCGSGKKFKRCCK